MFFRGQTVGKYKILSPLGSGGFGTVYLAEDTWIDKKVAIKVPHRQNVDFGDLLREPRLLASLSHPNIVSILTAEKQANLFFIVMEYVPGDTLETVISRDGRIDLARTLDYTCQICNAVDHAHQHGVLHRDLRPGNVLVTEGGIVKVADFGTSRFIEIAAHGTTVIGSPPYMAPEQFHGKAVFASDIYSLGVTMYQMLTGVLPYNTPAPADLEKLMKGELISPPRTRNPKIPAEDRRHRHEGGRARCEKAVSARERSAEGSSGRAWAAQDHACDAAANAHCAGGCGVIFGRCAGHSQAPARARDSASPFLLALPQAAPRPICALPVLWRSAVDAKLFSRSTKIMAFAGTGKIWMNGKLVEWKDANIHIASHVIHYGSGVFEGARVYDTPKGSAILRLDAHMARLIASAKIYRMECPYTQEQLEKAVIDTVQVNGFKACYIRPLMYRGYAALGVNPLPCPVDVAIMVWEWGTYLGADALEKGVDVCVSSWNRMAPNTFPSLSKTSGNYANAALIRMEAEANGYSEGIALDTFGFVSEGSGENIFVVRNGIVHTPPLSASILPGHHARHGDTDRRRSRVSRVAGEHPARNALHRRRGLLRRHGGRTDARALGGQDHGRQRPPRSDYRSDSAPVPRHDPRQSPRYARLADLRAGNGRCRCQRPANTTSRCNR